MSLRWKPGLKMEYYLLLAVVVQTFLVTKAHGKKLQMDVHSNIVKRGFLMEYVHQTTCSLVNSLSKKLLYLHHQLLAPMAMFNWWEVLPPMKGGWRCASTMTGGQCAMTLGVVLMLQWSAGNWDMQPLDVSNSTMSTTVNYTYFMP